MLSAGFFSVLSRIVRLASIVAVLFIVAGLIGFLTDEVRDTSQVQATRFLPTGNETVTLDITQPDPPAQIENAREEQHTSAREVIDDVGDRLMAPFTWIIEGSRPWVRRLLYSALALILYGLLMQVLADLMARIADGSRRAAVTERERKAAEERKRSGSFVSPA